MAHQQLTIYRSFQNCLPNLNLGPANWHGNHALSSTAQQTDPPKVWVACSPQTWISPATGLVENHRNHPLLGTYVSAIERPFLMHNEADVVRATVLYLLHPVNQAINAQYGHIFCAAEDQGNGPLRCDVVWKIWRDGEWSIIAILELKKRGVLSLGDFIHARVNYKDIPYHIQRALREPSSTFLKGNAVTLSQQAAAYAWKRNTKYVALFDWNSLFLYSFAGLDAKSETVGDWAYGTWIVEDPTTTFRKAILGFLITACMAKNV